MKYFSKNNSLQKDLIDLSVFLGNNLDCVQGAGGNTSVKDKSNISVDSFIYQS
jgi:rhamnose utilization protein RhaD (predicted bifunctional aldolase and dehydrogenase)